MMWLRSIAGPAPWHRQQQGGSIDAVRHHLPERTITTVILRTRAPLVVNAVSIGSQSGEILLSSATSAALSADALAFDLTSHGMDLFGSAGDRK